MYHQTAQSVGTGSGRQKHHDFPGRTWTSSVTLSTTHQMKGKRGLCVVETTTSAVSERKDGLGDVIALKANNIVVLNRPHLSSSVIVFGPWTELSTKTYDQHRNVDCFWDLTVSLSSDSDYCDRDETKFKARVWDRTKSISAFQLTGQDSLLQWNKCCIAFLRLFFIPSSKYYKNKTSAQN